MLASAVISSFSFGSQSKGHPLPNAQVLLQEFHANRKFITSFPRMEWGKSCVHPQDGVRRIQMLSQFTQEPWDTIGAAPLSPCPWQPM